MIADQTSGVSFQLAIESVCAASPLLWALFVRVRIFKGAATTVITGRNKDPIHARYQRLLDGGTKPTLAKLSLARMIAATVLRMWKDEEEYDPGRGGPSTATREG